MPYQMTTTLAKTELLARLRDNRDKHREVFLAALDGYAKRAHEILATHLQQLASGRYPELRIALHRPEDHTKDYERIIAMVSLDQGETFELDEHDFARYYMDDWEWKQAWVKMSSAYAAGSTRQHYSDYLDDVDA